MRATGNSDFIKVSYSKGKKIIYIRCCHNKLIQQSFILNLIRKYNFASTKNERGKIVNNTYGLPEEID